jgi:hypothetical protein
MAAQFAFTHDGTAYTVFFPYTVTPFSDSAYTTFGLETAFESSLLLPLYPFLALEALHHESGNAFLCTMIIVSLGWCGSEEGDVAMVHIMISAYTSPTVPTCIVTN